MPIISVIIPVYNVEQYLRECIDSVLASSFHDFELILIDDGSKDNSGSICDEYAVKDSRIKVLHVENGGVSKARNIGIKVSKAPWLTFIDSDDFVSTSFLSKLYSAIEEHSDVDFVHAGCMLYGESHDTAKEYLYPDMYSDDKNFLISEFRGLPFAKLFRRDIIINQNICFDELMKAQEDLLFCLDYICHVNKYVFQDSYEYFHRTDNQTSIMHSAFSPSYEYALHAANHFFSGLSKYVKVTNCSEESSLKRKKHVSESIVFAIYSLFLSREYSFRERTKHLRTDYSQGMIDYLKYFKGKKFRMMSSLLFMKQYWVFNILMTLSLKIR